MKDCSEIECLYLMVMDELKQFSATDVFAGTARSFISCLLIEDRYRKTKANPQGEDPTRSNWKQELYQHFAFPLPDEAQTTTTSMPYLLRFLLMRSGVGQYKDQLLQNLALVAGNASQTVVPKTEPWSLCLIHPLLCCRVHISRHSCGLESCVASVL